MGQGLLRIVGCGVVSKVLDLGIMGFGMFCAGVYIRVQKVWESWVGAHDLRLWFAPEILLGSPEPVLGFRVSGLGVRV